MDEWLLDHLVCPRDGNPLGLQRNELVCDMGHVYPIYDGIPVLLRDDVAGNHDRFQESLAQSRAASSTRQEKSPEQPRTTIDPYVQEFIAATNGHLYKGLIGKLKQYPIPEIRLTQ